ncbi:MAG: iron complex outerrane recepter protein [Verrucomicrobiota bacterium]
MLLATLCIAVPALGETSVATSSLLELPLSQLMDIPVSTPSRFEQTASEAPSSVTVITSDEIKRYGYRTLADVLRSVPGFYVSYDRNYAFLGTRGVNLGDFNSRILLMIDGHRLNSDLTDGAFIDTGFILDVDLIDRIEIVRGPGSVLYGDNAFFGVINVITRQGKQIDGAEISGEYGRFDTYKSRVTVGKSFTNGVQMLLSGSLYDSAGPERLFYKEFNTPEQNNGVAHSRDEDAFGSFFGSVSYRDLTLQGTYIERKKGNPTAQYFTTFNDPRLRTVDEQSYVSLKYEHSFPDVADVMARLYYDRNDFQIGYPVAPSFFKEQQEGQRWGTELQLNKKLWDRHVITVGGEYRDDFEQHRRVFEPATGTAFTDVHQTRQNYGVYVQGEFEVVTNLHLNAGVRYDQYGDFDPSVSPRAALIYHPFPTSTLKAIYGTAFRAPNFLELSDPRFQDIGPEKITSYELVYEQEFGHNLKSSLSGFYNQMDDLITFQNGSFTNFNADATGVELALEGSWKNGIRTRASYTYQETENRETNRRLTDSPNHLGKFNVSAPVFKDKIFASLEFQYTSSRHTMQTTSLGEVPGEDAAGFGIVNFTLFSQNLVKNLEFSGSIYNLLDRNYGDPATRFHQQDIIRQDGRSFRVKLTYRF